MEWRVPSRGGAADFLGNALLFVPLGFGLAGLAVALGTSPRRQIIGAGLMCVSLATVIEIVQLTIPSRDPAISDILANGAGGVGGAIIWRFAGRRLLQTLAGVLAESGSGYFSASRIGITFVLYASLVFGGSLIIARTRPFAAWAGDARLSVGAASAGEWGGRVSDLLIADSPMTPPAVEAAVRLVRSGAVAPEGVFTFDPDSQAKSASQDVGRDVTRRVVASCQLTVAATLAAAEPEKPGQSHIVKLGTDTDQINVSLLQQDAHLLVRLNTPLTGTTGEHPQFLLPYLFADGQPHRVCISFDGRALRTHADGRSTGAVDMSPETLLTWRILPFRPVYMVLGRTDTRLWRLAYDVAVFAPLGILAGLFALATPHSARFRVLAFVSAVSLPPVAMQIVVGSMSGVGGTWWWRRGVRHRHRGGGGDSCGHVCTAPIRGDFKGPGISSERRIGRVG